MEEDIAQLKVEKEDLKTHMTMKNKIKKNKNSTEIMEG